MNNQRASCSIPCHGIMPVQGLPYSAALRMVGGNAQGSAERRGPSASVPSTPRRPATREPSVRARRAVLRESNVQWATSHSPARRHRSDGPHVPVSVSGWAAAPPHHSRGSSSGSSSSAPLGKFLPWHEQTHPGTTHGSEGSSHLLVALLRVLRVLLRVFVATSPPPSVPKTHY